MRALPTLRNAWHNSVMGAATDRLKVFTKDIRGTLCVVGSLLLVGAGFICAQQAPSLPEAPRPFTLNTTIEQRYSFKTMHATNPVGLSVSFHTPLNGYRMSVGYSFNPQTIDHAVTAAVSVRVLSFGPRRR